jgi:hypothetical protein
MTGPLMGIVGVALSAVAVAAAACIVASIGLRVRGRATSGVEDMSEWPRESEG